LCRRTEPPFVKAVAYGSYDGGLRELIHLLKYEQVRPACVGFGPYAGGGGQSPRIWLDRAPDRGAAVPLHARKLRQRGFNHLN